MRDETLALIQELLVEEWGIERDAVVAAARLQEDLDLSSLDVVELLMMLEERTGVRLAMEVAPQPEWMATVGALASLVDEQVHGLPKASS